MLSLLTVLFFTSYLGYAKTSIQVTPSVAISSYIPNTSKLAYNNETISSFASTCKLGHESGVLGFAVGLVVMTLSWLAKMRKSYYLSKNSNYFNINQYIRQIYKEDKILYICFILGFLYGLSVVGLAGIFWFLVGIFLGLNFETILHYFIIRNVYWNARLDRTPNIVLVDLFYAFVIITLTSICIFKLSLLC